MKLITVFLKNLSALFAPAKGRNFLEYSQGIHRKNNNLCNTHNDIIWFSTKSSSSQAHSRCCSACMTWVYRIHCARKNDGTKGPNAVVTSETMWIQIESLDNCAAQLKNITRSHLFVSLECGWFKEICHILPGPRHVYLFFDQDFAVLEKEARCHEVVYDRCTWLDWCNMLSITRLCNVQVIDQDFKDYSSHFLHYCRKVPSSTRGSKFATSKYSQGYPGRVAIC